MRGIRRYAFLIAVSLIFTSAFVAYAQSDPPDRVARLNLLEGAVSFLPAGGNDDEWVTATLNRPLTTGDRIWADANSRSEMHIGSTAIRMNGGTGLSFLDLDSTNVQIRLSNGSIIVKLRILDPDDAFEVDTPNLAFAIKRPGNYRIDANPDSIVTTITVWQGEGEIIGGGRSWQVISDQQVALTGSSSLDYDLRDAEDQPLSDFDRWARNRDDHEDRAASARYVSREMTGSEDLDAYGAWRQIPSYGWCWSPARVEAGWAPYRYGHWTWISPWGWTWVEEEPWGFAPFHYGRWMYYQSAWFWVPGPVAVRPVYAPALVAWVGGSGFNISVSIGHGGGIGWFPLGPREVFVPSYRVTERYVTNINMTNTVISRETIINTYNGRDARNLNYANRGVASAVTVVSHDTFVNARPVARNIVSVRERDLAAAPVSHEVVATPDRSSIFGAGQRGAARPPDRLANLPVVTRRTPPPEPGHIGQSPGISNGQTPATPTQRLTNRTPEPGAISNRPNIRSDRPAQTSQPQVTPPQVTNPPITRPQVNTPQSAAPRESHPLARPAPEVKAPTAKEQNDAAAKRKAWENARQKKNEKKDRGKEQKEDRNKSPHP